MHSFTIFAASAVFLVTFSHWAHAECISSGDYYVCSESQVDASGNVQIRSWDSEGNDYSINSETYRSPNGDTTIRSYDNEGNSYSVRSWSDSTGVHSMDGEGNICTITKNGTVIGC